MNDMKTMAIVLMAVLLATGAVCAQSQNESSATALVTVRIYDSFGVRVDDITAARTGAEAILRAAGIQPIWIQCPRFEAHRSSSIARCEEGIGPKEIVVRIRRSSPSETVSLRVPLGEALVNLQTHTGSFATVFADRVFSTSDRAGANPRDVLGRVIAHEIGHLLLGTNHHAAQGLMRRVWTDKELRRPVGLEWRFSESGARRMHAGVVERADGADFTF